MKGRLEEHTGYIQLYFTVVDSVSVDGSRICFQWGHTQYMYLLGGIIVCSRDVVIVIMIISASIFASTLVMSNYCTLYHVRYLLDFFYLEIFKRPVKFIFNSPFPSCLLAAWIYPLNIICLPQSFVSCVVGWVGVFVMSCQCSVTVILFCNNVFVTMFLYIICNHRCL